LYGNEIERILNSPAFEFIGVYEDKITKFVE